MTDTFMASLTVRAIGWALMQSVWQGAVIGVATAFALRALRRSAASLRYAVACLGLTTLVVVPVLTAVLHARELRTSGIRIDLAAPVFVSLDGRPVAAPESAPSAGSRETSSVSALKVTGRWPNQRLEEWSLIAVPLWLVGVLALFSRLVAGWLMVERIRRAAARQVSAAWLSRVRIMADRLGVTRPVRIVESAVVSGPMVAGWLRPVILLPASALTGLAPAQLEAVIAHELAHIRRHDYLVNLLQTTVETLLFYHPASWWISRQIRVERENCCDDIAVEMCGDRLTYARALADLEQMRGSDMELALAATGGSLIYRIRRLLGRSSADQDHSPTWAVVCAVLAILALVVMREDVKSAQASGEEGAIRGQVVDARSGLPLARATLDLSADGPIASVATDADGRYEARGLKPGEYRLFVRAPGFVASQYGQRQAGEDGTGVEVRGGQITSRVDVRLQPAGIISGRIFDDAGEGLAGVEIEVIGKRSGAGGALPAAGGFAQTEASGVFRVGDLQEGEYYVRAYAPKAVRPSKGDATQAYAPTYFPQAARIDEAQPLLVFAGQELFDVNFALATVRKRVVSGTLVDPSGLPLDRARVHMIMLRGGTFSETAPVASNGTFQIRDVVPGDYMLRVGDAGDSTRWFAATRHITVDDDVTVELVARFGARLEGRIVRENGDPLPFDPRAIEVTFEQRVEGPAGTANLINHLGRKVVQRDGTFSIESPGGASFVQVSQLPSNWTIKAIRLDGADITDQATDFGDGALRHVEIVVTDRISGVVGLVTDRNNRIVLNHTVVVFPEDANRWKAPSRFVRTARPRQDGRFEIEDLPPADYFAVAVESLPRNASSDPKVLERLWPLATRFELRESERRALQLKLSATPNGLLD
jgi:beta-lactamase regulating signal transducer with metallopeptidase domain